jgi:cation transport regulator ChaB
MRYRSIEDLPFVCRYNLPEAALRVYRDAYNRAWEESSLAERDRVALHRAWEAVRECFEKEELTGRWMPRPESRPSRPQSSGVSPGDNRLS